MPLFVKIEQGIVEKATFDQFVPAHIEYVKKLIANGHQARSGYWGDFGGGMLLFEAESKEQAQEIVENDPLLTLHLPRRKGILGSSTHLKTSRNSFLQPQREESPQA